MSGFRKAERDGNKLLALTSLPIPSRSFLIQYAMKPQSEDWLKQANYSTAGSEFGRKENEARPCDFSIPS